ncbi:replicative DNA helicase [Polaribacter aestuariivivens]|uniref:replicative DNA helicase n=1 Tax=Polaribacter aestuariivivens TaxID=2304626 RepID=UPI003F499E52
MKPEFSANKSQNQSSKIISLERGKIPPQAIELEKAVLGAMMIDKNGCTQALELLDESSFYDFKHQIIFQAITDVFKKSKAVDLLTVSEQLKKSGNLEKVGGDIVLIRLTQSVASSAHIEHHSRIIIQKNIQRELIKNLSEIIENAYGDDADVFNLFELSYSKLNEITKVTTRKKEQKVGDVLPAVLEKARKITSGEIKAGIPTPFTKLTEYDGGWRNDELIIIAARPGMGKTSMALLAALEPAKSGIPTAFFSLEMSAETLVSRVASMEFKIYNDKFNKKGINEFDEEKITTALDNIPMFIDDTSSITIEEFQIKANRLKSEHDIKLIVIDYIQLMEVADKKGKNREQEVSKISRGLKSVALELNIPIIALSQLSRAVETRGGSKRPLLSDLRESGAIEQDADIVSFIYRPEYYGITEWDDNEHTSCQGQAEFITSKNRNGALSSMRFQFDAKFTLFSDLEKPQEFEPEDNYIPRGNPEDVFEIEPTRNDPEDLPF